MKHRIILYVSNGDTADSDAISRLRALCPDLMVVRESLAAAVLFLNRNIEVVVLENTASPDVRLERLIHTLRPDVKIIASNQVMRPAA